MIPLITTVEQAAAHIVRAFAAGNKHAYFAAFHTDARFVFASEPAPMTLGEYQTLWAALMAEQWEVLSWDSTEQHVQVHPNSAIFTHRIRTTAKLGDTTVITDDDETIVFVAVGDQLIAVHEHVSPRLTEVL